MQMKIILKTMSNNRKLRNRSLKQPRPMGVRCQLERCFAWSVKHSFALAFFSSVWHVPRRLDAEHICQAKTKKWKAMTN